MRILFDAMSGDNAPLENLRGARRAADQLPATICLVGDEKVLRQLAQKEQISLDKLEFMQADGILTMEDEPTSILKENKNCSMAVGFRALAAGEGDVFVSAGNTGALVVGATFLVKRMRGMKRVALAPVLPSKTGHYLLLDVGANAECRPEMLVQFGLMGSVYAEKFLHIKNPRVGLLNIGTEPHKGTPLQQEAYALMQNAPYNFIGNAEARDVPLGVCDVAVCDGFTGNVVLKTTEGLSKMLMGGLKDVFYANLTSKLGALLLKKNMMTFKKQLDYKEFGGAILLGANAPVIKAHGSSDSKAFFSALRQAAHVVEGNVVPTIRTELERISKSSAPTTFEPATAAQSSAAE